MRRLAASRFAATLLAAVGADQAFAQSLAEADAVPAGIRLADGAAAAPAPPSTVEAATVEGATTVLGVRLNGKDVAGDTTFAVRNGVALVPADDLRQWRLRVGNPTPVMIDNQAFVPLEAVAGLTYRIDGEHQRLELTVPAEAFEATSLSSQSRYLPPTETVPTAVLNYDLSFENSANQRIAAGFLQMGASNDHGLISNTMTVGNSVQGKGVVRLDTYIIRDDPEGRMRLTIGDSLTAGSSWSPQVRFAGVHYGTDFGLQPGFQTFPSPTFGGRASLPSNVEIYVDNALSYQAQVREGPFTLDRLPVVTGSGEATLVVRDALGVERRIVTDYYISSQLLRQGLSDYSWEMGAERRGYGTDSFDYGRPFTSGTWRYGLTRGLTIETRGELGMDLQNLGVGFSSVLGKLAEFGGSVAASRSDTGTGYLYRLYVARVGPRLSFSVNYQRETDGFAQLGYALTDVHPITQLQASLGFSVKRYGSFSASYTALTRSDGERTRVQSATYSRSLGRRLQLGAFLLHTSGGDEGPDTTAGASLSISFGTRTNAFLQASNRSRHLDFQRSLPDDRGFGYDLTVDQGEIDQQKVDLSYRGRIIEGTASISRYNGQLAERLLASGALVLADGSVLPTRRLDEGFAIVELPGEANVTVLQENRAVTTTNKNGMAIVRNLRPYEANRIGLIANELDLDATINHDTLMVVPRTQSAVRARFDIAALHAGTIVVSLPDGKPLEPGTAIIVAGAKEPSYSGFDGEVFLSDMREGIELVAQRPAGACRLRVPPVPKGEVLPRIGPVACQMDSGK